MIRHLWAGGLLLSLCLTAPLPAGACGEVEWTEVEAGIAVREDCYEISAGQKIDFTLVRFVPAEVRLRLVGGMPDLSVPSAKTLVVEKGKSNLFTMQRVFKQDGAASILLPVGDVIAEEYKLPGALVRQNGVDLAERNNIWPGASAFFCLNDKSQNKAGTGSAFVMFNAFEGGKPVEMNERVADTSNCPDVVQVGPRVVEYRSKPGIPIAESRLEKNQLQYAIFAQGSGPTYDGYILINKDPANLYYLQELLLGRGVASSNDTNMRMAVNLISGDPVSLIVGTGGDVVHSEGPVEELTWPVYLAVEPLR